MNESTPQAERETKTREMKAEDVLAVLSNFDDIGIEVWLDGGWGVDALLDRQTRPHGDVDIVVRESDLSELRETLLARGFKDETGDPWNFVLSDGQGHEVDVHVINFDENGDGQYAPEEKAIPPYPASAFVSWGSINGVRVRCIGPEYQVTSHTGYELDDDDFHDVSALSERFSIPIPADYEKWLSKDVS